MNQLTQDQINEVRRLAGLEANDPTYTAIVISDYATTASTLNEVVSRIWREKAASVAELVDITEGSSTRRLSQLYRQSLEMAAAHDRLDAVEDGEKRRGARTRPIQRA